MPRCPVCAQGIDADDAAFAHHVDGHFADGASLEPTGAHAGGSLAPLEDDETDAAVEHCLSCGRSLAHMTGDEKNRHVSDCLDGRGGFVDEAADWAGDGAATAGQDRADNTVDADWDGPAPPGEVDWRSRKTAKGDRWWDPVKGGALDVPANYAPGLLPVVCDALDASVVRGHTRSAVVARDTVHTKSAWGFDIAWGCGYRNALMAISALVLARPSYRPLFSREAHGADPGVRRVQGWIEEAWAAGFDDEGRQQLKGRVLGTRKWIGTTDLYAMFSYLGVSCELYDFPKPKDRKRNAKSGVPTHYVLQQWVRRYFAADLAVTESGSAFDVLMRSEDNGSGRGQAVRRSTRFPMILQHMGHSRTIVGYEETARGDVNLLLFDPGRSIPKDLRAAGITHVPAAGSAADSQSALTGSASGSTSHANWAESGGDHASPAMTGEKRGRGGAAGQGSTSTANEAASRVEDDEEVVGGGWVRKKVRKVIGRQAGVDGADALAPFRVNLSKLSAHAAYQVLVFTGGAVLTPAEWAARRHVYSTQVCE